MNKIRNLTFLNQVLKPELAIEEIQSLLTQQRAELEKTTGEIIADQLNQAKIETRTELLEEILEMIENNKVDVRSEIQKWITHKSREEAERYNYDLDQIKEQIINLLNKK